MKMTLTEARLVLDNKENELRTLFSRRNACLVNVYKKKDGEKELTHEAHEFTVDDLTKQIDTVKKEIRKLRLITTEANVATPVDFTVDGEKITLQEAIYLIKQFRDELPSVKKMGEMKATSQIVDPSPNRFVSTNGVDRSYEQVTEPTFDTKAFRSEAEKLEKLITKLELAISQANLVNSVDVPFIEE